jgi:hypothetical protein
MPLLAILMILGLIVAFFWAKGRLLRSVTDSETQARRKQLGQWYLVLFLLFWIFVFITVLGMRR